MSSPKVEFTWCSLQVGLDKVFAIRRGEDADVIGLEVSSRRPPLRIEVAGEAAEFPNNNKALLPPPVFEIPPKSLALFVDIILVFKLF